jgi:hypothetical protein
MFLGIFGTKMPIAVILKKSLIKQKNRGYKYYAAMVGGKSGLRLIFLFVFLQTEEPTYSSLLFFYSNYTNSFIICEPSTVME